MSDKSEKQEIRDTYKLFAPKSDRGLRVDYPELRDYEELKALKNIELLFVWNYACKSSPYFNLEKKEREVIEICARKAGMHLDDPEKKERFLSGNFGERISSAIPVMHQFEPSARIQGKLLAATQLQDIKKMTSLELDEYGNHPSFNNKGGDLDMTKKKYYLEMILKANSSIGEMIAKAERGFGVTVDKKNIGDKNRDSSGETFAENYHNNN